MDIVLDTAKKIQTMEIRGAGTIARAAAGALKDYSQQIEEKSEQKFNTKMSNAANVLVATRPTAVSLPNAIRMVTLWMKPEPT